MSNDAHNGLNQLSIADMFDGMQVFITGPVVAGTLCPGVTLCAPGIILLLATIVVPLVLAAVLAVVLGAVVAAPYLLVRKLVSVPARTGSAARPAL